MAQLELLRSHLGAVRGLVGSLSVESLSGVEAARLAGAFAAAEHACAAGKALCAKRVADTRHYEREGHKDASSWLADTTGDTRGASKDAIETARELEHLPGLNSAFRSGELSAKEASEIAGAGSVNREAEAALLQAARAGSLVDLREMANDVKAAARSGEDDERRHARIRANRHLRTWSDRDGSFSGRFSLAPEDGAVVMARLVALGNRLFDEARREGRREQRAAYLADALVLIAGGEPAVPVETSPPSGEAAAPRVPGSRPDLGSRPDCTILMRIDLEALVRGALQPGEECSIDGAGHVPVSVVQRYLDLAKLRLVVTKGTDIKSVYSFSRTIPAALRTALLARDRTCVVPGCSSTFHLEIDHIHGYAKGGPTTLANLCRLCRYHHRLKSVSGFRLEGGPDGWRWLAPAGPGPPPPASGAVS